MPMEKLNRTLVKNCFKKSKSAAINGCTLFEYRDSLK